LHADEGMVKGKANSNIPFSTVCKTRKSTLNRIKAQIISMNE
jgi:hypothetical protein